MQRKGDFRIFPNFPTTFSYNKFSVFSVLQNFDLIAVLERFLLFFNRISYLEKIICCKGNYFENGFLLKNTPVQKNRWVA